MTALLAFTHMENNLCRNYVKEFSSFLYWNVHGPQGKL